MVRKSQLKAVVNDLLANNRIFRHDGEVSTSDDVPVTSGGNEDVGTVSSILHGRDLVTGHGSLESVDGVNFGDEDAGTIRLEGLSALEMFISKEARNLVASFTYSFANISVASNDGDLASKHDVSGTLDTINERFAAAVVVVELGLGDGVVDVDGGDLELAITESLVQVMNTGGGFLRNTVDA